MRPELAAFLSALFTAIVAFTGVVLTNRSAQKRHSSDLEHAEKTRQAERKADLRKLIYLEALSDLGSISAVLGNLWDFDKPLSIEEGMVSKAFGSSYRLLAIADMKTIKALSAAGQAAGEVAVKAVSLRMTYERRKITQQRVQSFFERAAEHHKSVVAQLANDSSITPEKRKGLEEERDRLLRLVEESGKRLVEIVKSLTTSKIDILLVGAEVKAKFDQELQAVIVAIRAELDFPLDEAEFHATMQSSSDQLLRLMRTTTDSLRGQIEEVFDEQSVNANLPRPSK